MLREHLSSIALGQHLIQPKPHGSHLPGVDKLLAALRSDHTKKKMCKMRALPPCKPTTD